MVRRLSRVGAAVLVGAGSLGIAVGGASTASAASVDVAGSIRLDLVVNGIAFDARRDVIYATVHETDANHPNKVVSIDPLTAEVVAARSLGTKPSAVTVAPDGSAIYVGIDGQGAVAKYTLPSFTLEWSASLGPAGTGGLLLADEIEVLPGDNDVVAVSMRRLGVSPPFGGIAVIDDGVVRPTRAPDHTGSNSIVFGDTANPLYGSGTGGFRRHTIDAGGITVTDSFPIGGGDIEYHDGFVYGAGGAIIDVSGATPVLADTLAGGDTIAIDEPARRVYIAERLFGSDDQVGLAAYDIDTSERVGEWNVPAAADFADRMITIGDGILAFIDLGHPAYREGHLVLVEVGPVELRDSFGEYVPLTPKRILDTRSGLGRDGTRGPVGPGKTIEVQVAGVGGIPTTGAMTVVMNVTAVFPTQAGYLTVYPTGIPRPTISNLNFAPGAAVANLVTMPLGDDGKVSVYNPFGSTDVLFDVAGYYAAAAGPDGLRFHATDPERFLDTRDGTGGRLGALGAEGSVTLQVGGVGTVPAGARAVALNVTTTGTTAPSFVSVYPSDVSLPTVSNLNFGAGATIANQVVVRLPANGRVTLYNRAGSSHVIVDVVGYYDDVESGDLGRFVPVAPFRSIDTRLDSPFDGDGSLPPFGLLYAGERNDTFAAYVVNVTVTATQGLGYVSVFPYELGEEPPGSSTLNYAPGQTVPNHAIARTGPYLGFYNANGRAHLIVDVFGAFL